ncbi:RidA family protein [Pontibacter sp. G13]|uniref:RidA family protein n=1 Tax=Pontibacter sp. G13 TaxID=3074898 RepID=UPI002889E058|nr:RidA family protein [Pontibacter sp. G13]WNJ17253.1 RidA family protein [Pontibacter sp. G13]
MASKRINIASGTAWEDLVGYSRAVRVGNIVEVAGTTATEGSEILFPHQPYEQTQYILLKIEQALKDAGASLKDVVRTRMYVTNIFQWEEIGRAHQEVFKDIKPVATMVEVSDLIDEQLVVEIEATAIIADEA